MPSPHPILPPARLKTLASQRTTCYAKGRTIQVEAHTRVVPSPLPAVIRLLARFSDLETAVHRLCSQADRNRAAGISLNASDRAAARAAVTLLTDTFNL
jgi:hypothetical protein